VIVNLSGLAGTNYLNLARWQGAKNYKTLTTLFILILPRARKIQKLKQR
jgi:hypothetical protein